MMLFLHVRMMLYSIIIVVHAEYDSYLVFLLVNFVLMVMSFEARLELSCAK
jgi:hypothetical protein